MSDQEQRERPVQDTAWIARAVALALPMALPVTDCGTAERSEVGTVECYRVPSARKPDEAYAVERVVASGEWYCTCPAGAWGKPCRHVGSALEYRERQAQANRTGRECPDCGGLGTHTYFLSAEKMQDNCKTCNGTGWLWLSE